MFGLQMGIKVPKDAQRGVLFFQMRPALIGDDQKTSYSQVYPLILKKHGIIYIYHERLLTYDYIFIFYIINNSFCCKYKINSMSNIL